LLSASKYVSPFWLTIGQANELGGHVRKGEESTVVVFWKVDDAKQSTEDLDNEETDGKTRRRFLLRYYRVFNLEQCELLQTVLDKLPKTEAHEHGPIEGVERIVAEMKNAPAIEHTGSKAFYSSFLQRHPNSATGRRLSCCSAESLHIRRLSMPPIANCWDAP
jgi:antirestriction protein ArdC